MVALQNGLYPIKLFSQQLPPYFTFQVFIQDTATAQLRPSIPLSSRASKKYAIVPVRTRVVPHISLYLTRDQLALSVLTQLMPALHGFYRAISSTLYCWTLSQWEALTTHLKVLCSPGIIQACFGYGPAGE